MQYHFILTDLAMAFSPVLQSIVKNPHHIFFFTSSVVVAFIEQYRPDGSLHRWKFVQAIE